MLTAVDPRRCSVAFVIDKYAPFIGGAERFHRDPSFEYHTLYFTPRTLRALLAREGFDVRALRTHLRAHPLYLGKGARRTVQRPIHALGGLVNRGPCIEVIAARGEAAREGHRS
jgi:hypothetical protein